jgi:hypothetical protein
MKNSHSQSLFYRPEPKNQRIADIQHYLSYLTYLENLTFLNDLSLPEMALLDPDKFSCLTSLTALENLRRANKGDNLDFF